jgi:hypothetical protein
MSERLKLLAEQATTIVEMVGPQGYASSYANFDREKFAELIVRECVMCMYRRGVEGFGILEERMLKEHFGVKE